jgi:CBS-domain-containing membrane protein
MMKSQSRWTMLTRLLWVTAGVSIAMAVAMTVVDPKHSPLLVASLGGSAIFLFCLTSAPAAQPRALFGGHIGGAIIGIACWQIFGDAIWVYVLAQVLTLAFMLVTRTVHPPAGANPLIMIRAHAGFAVIGHSLLAGLLCLAVIAYIWSRLRKNVTRYPVSWREGSRPAEWDGSRPARGRAARKRQKR